MVTSYISFCETVCVPSKAVTIYNFIYGFPVAQLVEHGAINAKIMGSIPRESKSWSNVKL